jgi:hypothetical protein
MESMDDFTLNLQKCKGKRTENGHKGTKREQKRTKFMHKWNYVDNSVFICYNIWKILNYMENGKSENLERKGTDLEQKGIGESL